MSEMPCAVTRKLFRSWDLLSQKVWGCWPSYQMVSSPDILLLRGLKDWAPSRSNQEGQQPQERPDVKCPRLYHLGSVAGVLLPACDMLEHSSHENTPNDNLQYQRSSHHGKGRQFQFLSIRRTKTKFLSLSLQMVIYSAPGNGNGPRLVLKLARNGYSTSQVPRMVVFCLLSPLLALQELNTKTMLLQAPPRACQNWGKNLLTVLQAYLLFFNLLPLGLLLPIKCWWDAIVNVESDCDPRKLKGHTKDRVQF